MKRLILTGSDNPPIVCKYCNTIRCQQCWKNSSLHFCHNCYVEDDKTIMYSFLGGDSTSQLASSECVVCTSELKFHDPMLSCGHTICYNDFMRLYAMSIVQQNTHCDNVSRRYTFNDNVICCVCRQQCAFALKYCSTSKMFTNDVKLQKIVGAVERFDFSKLYQLLVQKKLFTKDISRRAITQYKLFLVAKIYCNDVNGDLLSPAPIGNCYRFIVTIYSSNNRYLLVYYPLIS